MSTFTGRRCDNCGTATDDHYEEKGWLVIEGKVIRAQGRAKDRTGVTDFLNGTHDFCSLACFTATLDEQVKARKAKKT
jgi:hypothetical protein